VIRDYGAGDATFQKNYGAIDRLMSQHNIDRTLKAKIQAHLERSHYSDHNRDFDGENLMIARLTPNLKAQLNYSTLGTVLHGNRFFRENFSHHFLMDLSSKIVEHRFSHGEVLIKVFHYFM